MRSWICKDCQDFNEEILNRERIEEVVMISNDDNDMNEEIVEESVSRSASPARV
jgi:hypothetical protein